MSAEIHAIPNPYRYQAWCYDCGDGAEGSRPLVQRWAKKHNQDHHQASVTTGAFPYPEENA